LAGEGKAGSSCGEVATIPGLPGGNLAEPPNLSSLRVPLTTLRRVCRAQCRQRSCGVLGLT
jgi:hypothetical protein